MRDFERCSDQHGKKIIYLFAFMFLFDLAIGLLWELCFTFIAESYRGLVGWLFLVVVEPFIGLLMATALFKDVWKQAFVQFFNDIRHRSFGKFFYTLLAGLVSTVVVVWGIGPILFNVFGRPSINQQVVESLFRPDAFCIFYFMVIVAIVPFIEETEFRCGLYRLIRTKNVIAAHAISALLFGLAHVIASVVRGVYGELWFLVNYAIYGLALSITYEKTRCLAYPLLLHVLINLAAFTQIFCC